ncbi:MAG: hypothetical protein IPJ79_02655 [Bacteroidetes bacterium]|nr:hypothetical protein [Bacteroidota bacterium]
MSKKTFTPSTVKETPKTYYNAAHRDMIRRVVTFTFDPQNIAITNLVPEWKEALTVLRDKLFLIDDLFRQKALPITWAGLDKRKAKEALATESFAIMAPVNSWALKNRLATLFELTKASNSDLFYGKYSFLVDTSKEAYEAIDAVIDELEPIGITAAMLTAWNTKITAMENALSLTGNARAGRKTLNSQIQKELYNAVFMCIDQLDSLSVAYKATHPTYFTDYHNNRKLQPLGTTHTKLRVFVTDDLHQPIYDAFVNIPELGISGITTVSGDCTLYVPYGVHEATVSYNGKIVNTGPMQFTKGHTVTKKYVFETAQFDLPEHKPEKKKALVKK